MERVIISKGMVLIGLLFQITFMDGPHNLTRPRSHGVWLPGTASPCRICHASHNGGGEVLTPVEVGSEAGRYLMDRGAVSDRDLTCLQCHTTPGLLLSRLPGLVGETPPEMFLGWDLTDDHPLGVETRDPMSSSRLAGSYGVVDRETLRCATCHDPHQSPEPAMLREPVQDLCSSCHTLYPQPRGHNYGDCVACHRAHGRAAPEFLDPAGVNETCRSCHPALPASHPAVSPLQSRQPQPAAVPETAPGLCSRCHSYHAQSPSEVRYVWE